MQMNGILNARMRGLSLIELLVSIVIALVVIAAIGNMIVFSEEHKRKLTSTNDMEQGSNYAMVQLDSTLRSAGSGFLQSNMTTILGCRLAVGSNSTRLLPTYDAWPAPFEKVLESQTDNLILAPLLIAEKTGPRDSDSIISMRGNGSAGDITRYLNGPSSNSLVWPMITTTGFKTNDLVLVSNTSSEYCLMENISSAGTGTGPDINTVDLYNSSQSRFYTDGFINASGDLIAELSNLNSDKEGNMTVLGSFDPSTGKGSNVEFYMFGIDDKANLHRYDILQLDGKDDADLIIADGIVAMYALYGIDSDADGVFDAWVSPQSTSSPYTIEKLSTSNRADIAHIVALRVALVTRSPLKEKEAISTEELEVFSDLVDKDSQSLQRTVTLDASEQLYRHRVIEATIPIRNALISADPRFKK